MKIVYSCNNIYLKGLYLSILSIVRRTQEPIEFYLLTANCTELKPKFKKFTQKSGKIISELLWKYSPQSTFQIIDCQKQYNQYIKGSVNRKSRFSPYATFRLFLHLFDCFQDRVLYLDVDTMAFGDVAKFNKVNMHGAEFAVSHDCMGRYWISDDYFNSGVILFDMKKCRKTGLFQKCLGLIRTKKMFFPDQTALYKSATKFIYFPNEYRFNRQQVKIKKGDIIKHFCAKVVGWPKLNDIKQWDIKNVHKILKIHEFDEDFKIYQKEKRNWNK